jgi:hypothetical protein
MTMTTLPIDAAERFGEMLFKAPDAGARVAGLLEWRGPRADPPRGC